jgi:gallate decarboxylase subunit D
MVKSLKCSVRKGACRIEAEALLVGEDLVVSLWGGSRPHVGAVALAVPRRSLKSPSQISATSSVLTRLGHKEDEIVKGMSERLAAGLNRAVVVSAGMHWDQLAGQEMAIVCALCEELTRRLIHRVLREQK